MITQTQTIAGAGHSDVLAALRTASSKTGLDFNYLLHTAMRESSLNVEAKSKSSSATGLFQFIDQTWLGLVKQYGERYGLGTYANSIEQGADGRYTVASAGTKSAILALRQDPELSAVMAGECAKQTKQSLECALGREVCGGELYAAHVFGPNGARHLIELKERNPGVRADLAFPEAAKANKSVFYHADGTAKTVGEVYNWAVNDTVTQTSAPVSASISAPALRRTIAQPQGAAAPSADINARDVFRALDAPQRSTADRNVSSSTDYVARTVQRNLYVAVAPNSGAAVAQSQGLPRSPMLLSPGVVEMLASLSATIRRAA
jgi:hypothetical protein